MDKFTKEQFEDMKRELADSGMFKLFALPLPNSCALRWACHSVVAVNPSVVVAPFFFFIFGFLQSL
jgi:hypothetical protein